MVMRRAPVRIPSGLKASARCRKLLAGLPSSSVPTPGLLAFQIRIADDDQSLFPVSHIEKTVEQRNGLLFIFGKLHAQRIDAERGGRRDCNGVFCRHEEFLANRGDRRGGDALGEAFVVDVGDVENAKAAFALRGVGIFAARLDIEDRARMFDARF